MQPRLFPDYAARPTPRERNAARLWWCAGQLAMFDEIEPSPGPSCAVCAGPHSTTECTIGTAPTLTEYLTVTVPPAFLADHIDRGCVASSSDEPITKGSDTGAASIIVAGRFGGRVLTDGKFENVKPSRTITVRLSLDDVRDLMSDAEHYASSTQDYGREMFGLCASARATVIALMRQGIERTTRYEIKGA